MWRPKKRPVWPGHATAHEAIRYLASVCDGAIRKDGYGFSTDHVAYGHWLADLPDQHWQHAERQNGLHLVRVYRRQLAQAGFGPDQIPLDAMGGLTCLTGSYEPSWAVFLEVRGNSTTCAAKSLYGPRFCRATRIAW